MKGAVWLIIVILIMIIVSVSLALFAFSKQKIVEKRVLQEKIILIGNRVEITGILIKQSTDLATLQALYDAGNFNLAIDSDLEYETSEKLPFWSRNEEEYIKSTILKLAEIYFHNYNKSFVDYFMDPKISKGRHENWYVEWEKNMKIEKFDHDEISINFGHFNITYTDSQIRISKKYPLVSHLKTKFKKTLDKSFTIIERIKMGDELNEIQKDLKDEDISLILEDKNNYVLVKIYENSKNRVYDFKYKIQDLRSLGLNFLVDKQGCFCDSPRCTGFCSWENNKYKCSILKCSKQKNLGIKISDLPGIKKCKNIYIISNLENSCDIFDYTLS